MRKLHAVGFRDVQATACPEKTLSPTTPGDDQCNAKDARLFPQVHLQKD